MVDRELCEGKLARPDRPAGEAVQPASEQAASMNRRILDLAADEKWQQLTDVVARRDALLARIPHGEREKALLAARHCTELLQTMAQSAKSRCAEQLAGIRRGRMATERYSANR